MTEKELKIVRQQAFDLPDFLFDYLLELLEKRLENRPFWLKWFHFFLGNAKWLEDTVRELVNRVKAAESQGELDHLKPADETEA